MVGALVDNDNFGSGELAVAASTTGPWMGQIQNCGGVPCGSTLNIRPKKSFLEN
jgi:hypothetical protein